MSPGLLCNKLILYNKYLGEDKNCIMVSAQPQAWRDAACRNRVGAYHTRILSGRPATPETSTRRRRSHQTGALLVTGLVQSTLYIIIIIIR